MPTLNWAIKWDWGAYQIDSVTQRALIQALLQVINGHKVGPDDVGRIRDHVPVIIGASETSFSARLEKVDPPNTFIVGPDTYIQIRSVADFETRISIKRTDMTSEPLLDQDLEDLVMFQAVFNATEHDSHYMRIYDSLVGIPKELILREIINLLTPHEKKEKWSKRHYNTVIPALGIMANKAPVMVIGGDPGTGKTALATSIGAPLASSLGERVHFHHLSLMLRGMGYQGRASGMIVKLFDYIRQKYMRLREPIILFFDEAEAVVGSRGETDSSSGAQENIAIVDAVIVGVDSLRKGLQARVVALFTTNLTDRVDSALLRRSYYYLFERPDEAIRRQLIENSLQGMGFSQSDLNKIVDATRPRKTNRVELQFTHSDIVELIVGRALNEAVSRDQPVSLDLLLDYCGKTKPTASVKT
jgi:hypothetical protein